MLKRSSFTANLDTLPAMMLWIEECINLLKLPPPDMRKVKLALEEAIVNVINHAYESQKGELDLIFRLYRKKIKFILKDKGFPFDPLNQKTKVGGEGGLGILLMREYMDEIYYERSDPYNCLTLVKKI
ncbi:MAG TPA: ATP-binding protein [Rhabdochlamydiaceae bacterium]|nr:ATP-binding protein [Rhabdochlamydiaceae bacterium]